jgi:hypothetical protein
MVTALAIFFAGSELLAQTGMDPSSALLLNPGGTSGAGGTASDRQQLDRRLESDRYTVRPRETNRQSGQQTGPRPQQQRQDETRPKAKQQGGGDGRSAVGAVSESISESETVLPTDSSGAVVLSNQNTSPPSHDPRSSEVDVSEESYEINRLMEISIGSGYLYEDSSSAYSYRRYSLASPVYSVQARVWLSSEFALGGRYHSSFGGAVSDANADVTAARNLMAAGLYYRKSFDRGNLHVGVEFMDTQFDVASTATEHVKTRTSGIRGSLEGEFYNSTGRSSWSIGLNVAPRIQHEEKDAGLPVRSGTSVEGQIIGLSIQRKWRFDSEHAMFIRIEHSMERDLFTGPASPADPISSMTPDGVTATTGTTLIQFGYNWGN